MKVTVDTNILVRAAVQDDAVQAKKATRLLKQADLIGIIPGSDQPILLKFMNFPSQNRWISYLRSSFQLRYEHNNNRP